MGCGKTWIGWVLAGVVCSPGAADEWPQWRGPQRDGVWRESGIIEKFTEPELKPLWRVPVGSGYSGPTVADRRVYVSDRVIEPQQSERVHCFDATTGKTIWSHSYLAPYEIGYPAGPRASITIDGNRAYALGAMGHLHCFQADTGTVLWKHDCNQEYKIDMPNWGIAASPLVEGQLVIVAIGGKDASVVAFDKENGREKWRALKDRAQYSAPIIVEQAGQRVLVCWTGDSVAGLDPSTGNVHWRHPFPPRNMPIGVATPVVQGDRLFLTSFYDGSLMLRLRSDKLAVEPIWRRVGRDEQNTEALHSIISTPLFLGDYIYGVDSYGELRCLRAKDGERVWEDLTATPKSRWSTIHFVVNGDKVWMFNERGELIISKLSPEGFDEISRAKLIAPTEDQLSRRGGVTWSHPAFAYGHVFARNDKELVCASLLTDIGSRP